LRRNGDEASASEEGKGESTRHTGAHEMAMYTACRGPHTAPGPLLQSFGDPP
jgi:hypothetical protein